MDSQPLVHVIATSVDGTRAALGAAVPLARGLSARLTVLVPHVVPFPIQLDEPAEPLDFFVRRYRAIVAEFGWDARIEVCLCRKVDDLIARLLRDDATVVIGGVAGRWLASPEERFANRVSRRVRRVLFVTDGSAAAQPLPEEEDTSCSTC